MGIEINNNNPFIIRIGWNNGGGHFVVGYGLQDSLYYAMDPWFNEGYTISSMIGYLTVKEGLNLDTHTNIVPFRCSTHQHVTMIQLAVDCIYPDG